MDDLTKKQEELTAELWKLIEQVDRRLGTMRNTLQQAGPGSSVTMMAGVLTETATELLRVAAKAEGHADAVRLM